MTFDVHAGGIYKVPFPFIDLPAQKARPALAFSEPDENGDVRFAFITTSAPDNPQGTFSLQTALRLEPSHFIAAPLPFQSFVRLEKNLLLHQSIAIKPLAQLTPKAMGEIFRRVILLQIPPFYHFQHGSAAFQPGTSAIHYAGRIFDEKDIGNLVDASLDFFLTANRYAEQFESDFAEFFGVSDALLVSSGSSANLLALTALMSPKLGGRRRCWRTVFDDTACDLR